MRILLAVGLLALFGTSALAQGTYILGEDGTPLPEPSPEAWQAYMSDNDRVVADDTIHCSIRVTTRFLGISKPRPSPLPNAFFQTKVSGGPQGGTTKYWATRAAALAGHQATVDGIRAAISPP